jgi:hypothetical protein
MVAIDKDDESFTGTNAHGKRFKKCEHCAFKRVDNCGGGDNGGGANCRDFNTVECVELIWFEDTDEGKARAMALRLEGIVEPL